MTTAPYADREVTQPPDWHDLVVWDFLFNAVSVGLFLVTAVADLARPDLFAPAARWAYPVALAVLTADLVFLVLDLGHPSRFHHMLRVFKPSSPMSLGTWCLTAYSLPLTVAAASSLFGWDETRRIAVVIGLLPAVGAVGYKGVLFSTSAQPGWRAARWLGAYHTMSAVALGVAGLLVLTDIACTPAATRTLRVAVMITALLATLPLIALLVELMPALNRRYPQWVTQHALLLPLGYWMPLVLLPQLAATWVDVIALLLTVVSAWLVRALVVRLPQTPHSH